ncbi:MAG: M56 family metallopeptidase, partial [Muribaculaceae bacterium]|nr:M56 family metallopeptidase [Muribaculaceae bacterium]
MGAFATYTFTAGVILLSLYIIYKWLLADDNQPRFNRAVLLSMYAVAFVLYPLVSLCHGMSVGTEGAIGLELPALAGTEAAAGIASAPLWPRIVLGVYLTGCAAVTVWALLIGLRLALIIAQGRREKRDGYTLVLLDRRDIAPFSWGRFVVMSRDEDSESADMILCHERAHIRAGHFIDLLIAQAVCILLWYNPASWLMLAELKDVHEYEADERVLGSGVNARQYQLLLIKKAVGIRFPSLANSLNHSKLKKRITMMY